MPVEVVLKLLEVIVKFFPPDKAIVDASSAERFNAPDVPVIFTAPVVTENPLEAVSNPADVMVPIPLVKIFPKVDKFPFSLIVKVCVPLD